jgi:uncharacterized protein YjdB
MYSGVFTGVGSGNANITYTSAEGCITTKTVSVEALPPVIAGGPTVCAGFAVNLTNSMPGGVWSSDPAAAGVGVINTITGVVTGITPGTVTVSYTIMTGCMRNLVVTVLVLPSVIGGSPQVCVGDSTTLTNTTTGGSWSISNPARATINPVTGVVYGISAGTAVVTYKVSSGCFNVLTIMVHPLPLPISGPGYVCVGATILLTNPTPGGVWISEHTDTATVGAGTGIVTGTGAGTTAITYSMFTGCKVTKMVTVNVTPPAITGNPHICIGSSNTFSNAMPGGIWLSSNPSVATVGLTTGVVTSVSLGTVAISYALPSTGCYAVKIATVQPLPTVYNVTGGGSYCEDGVGVHVGLNGSQPGVSYVLYYGSSVSGFLPGTGFTLDFGLLTPAGVYTVHASNVTSGCARNMAGSATVSIIPLVTPSVTIGLSPNDTVCPGTLVSVTQTHLNGGTSPTYVWKVNGAIVGTGTGYGFIPADGDVVSVTMTSNANCLSMPAATAERTLTVLPSAIPVANVLVNPDDSVCQFTPVTYTADPMFGGFAPIYTWMVNGTAAGTGPLYTYIPVKGDVVYLSMVSNYLCRLDDTVSSGTIAMEVDSMRIPHVNVWVDPGFVVEAGKPVTLHTTVTDAGPDPLYQWKVNGYSIPGATLSSYTAIFNDYDSISCVVTSSGSCHNIGTHDWMFITVNPQGVNPVTGPGSDIRLMPNPNNGTFNIRGTLGGTINEEISVQVTDMLGQVVYNGRLVARNGSVDENLLLGNDLANGMYMLNLEWGSERKVFHFAIRR